MINDKKNNVPENTIVIFDVDDSVADAEIFFEKPQKTREWFDSNFYRCLPLTIGNQYGFIMKTKYAFNAIWNGGSSPDDVVITYILSNNDDLYLKKHLANSNFGNGIITISHSFMLRTPKNINLMTITPPNFVIPNITFMTGVIETDNLRYTFSFNLKIQEPNVLVSFPAGSVIGAFIPVPRGFVENFNIKMAEDIFDKNIILEEKKAFFDQLNLRNELRKNNKFIKNYMKGFDIYGNKFNKHQLSNLNIESDANNEPKNESPF